MHKARHIFLKIYESPLQTDPNVHSWYWISEVWFRYTCFSQVVSPNQMRRVWIPFRKAVWNQKLALTQRSTQPPSKQPWVVSELCMHSPSTWTIYTNAQCTCSLSNAHENQDPCCTKVSFSSLLNMDTTQEDLLTCFQKKFPSPFPFLRAWHGEAEDIALPSCATSHNMNTTPAHPLIAPDPAMQIWTYPGLQGSLGGPAVLPLPYCMLTGTQGWPLRSTDKDRGFRLQSTWISTLAPRFSIFVFQCPCALPSSGNSAN